MYHLPKNRVLQLIQAPLFAPLVMIAPLSAAVMITDDFSSYGSTLTDGESTDSSVYFWDVFNHVNGSNSIPITVSGAELAGHFPGHTHPKNWTAEADLVFTTAARPTLQDAELTFGIIERHEFTELEVFVEGQTIPATFVFTGTGSARIEFTDTAVNEYLNGSFVNSRSYASLGWAPNDLVTSFHFVGLHHDNGSINRSYISNIGFSGIPEPSTSLLALTALGASVFRRKRD